MAPSNVQTRYLSYAMGGDGSQVGVMEVIDIRTSDLVMRWAPMYVL